MEFFKTIKMNLSKCLYFPNQVHMFNMKRLLITIPSFLVVVSIFSFFFYEADNVIEYVRTAYMSVTTLGIFVSFLSTMYKTNKIFILIDIDIEQTIRKSEYAIKETFSLIETNTALFFLI